MALRWRRVSSRLVPRRYTGLCLLGRFAPTRGSSAWPCAGAGFRLASFLGDTPGCACWVASLLHGVVRHGPALAQGFVSPRSSAIHRAVLAGSLRSYTG